jgi:hypothetical protein
MNPKKFKNSVRKPSETAETVAAHFSTCHRYWRRVGSRAATNEGNKTMDHERLLLLSSYAVCDGHCHLQQGEKRTNSGF